MIIGLSASQMELQEEIVEYQLVVASFRDNLGTFLGAFSSKIEVSTHFQVGLHGIDFALEYANRKNWRNIWLETDSMLVIHTFS